MPRRPSLLLAVVATLTIAACQAAPAAPALTDPKEILTKSAEATLKAKSFHFDVAVTGTFNADLMGSGSTSEFKLDGTTAAGDVDITGKNLKASFSAPAILGLTGEVIQVGQTSYFKSSLTGPQYQKTDSEDVPVDEVTDPAKAMEGLRSFLETPGLSPTKVADAKCGDNKDCYQVEFDLTGEELAALSSAAPDAGAELANGTFKLTVGVEKDTLRMSQMRMAVSMAEQGSVNVTMNMTKWDESVSIAAPPADQVAPSS
jgi:hypothetical protein